jgi:hypothetical protein
MSAVMSTYFSTVRRAYMSTVFETFISTKLSTIIETFQHSVKSAIDYALEYTKCGTHLSAECCPVIKPYWSTVMCTVNKT